MMVSEVMGTQKSSDIDQIVHCKLRNPFAQKQNCGIVSHELYD